MNVRIKMTRKRVQCRYCHQMIETGEYQVVCTYFMQPKACTKKWMKEMHFHAKDPYCWVDQGVQAVSMQPHTENRGRKCLPIPDATKVIRLKIMRRRAATIQRIDIEMRGKQRPDKLSHLTDILERLKVEIAPYGGVPVKWNDNQEVTSD